MSEIDVILFIHSVSHEEVTFPKVSTPERDLPEAVTDAVVCMGVVRLSQQPSKFVQIEQFDTSTGEYVDAIVYRPELRKKGRRGFALDVTLFEGLPAPQILKGRRGIWVSLDEIQKSRGK